ncbi:MAG: toxic anion resistance protein [Anaerovoracaceae bacterium]
MEFKEQMTPTLTLDSFEETEKTETTAAEFQEPVQKMEMQEKIVEENPLSAEEKQMVEDFARQINLDDSAAILRYGSGTQKKMADFSETALEKVKTKDLGEVGDLITGVVNELKGFDATEEKGLFGFFKKGKNKLETLKTKYAKVETNVENICKVLEGHQIQLLKDIAVLDKMYEANLVYFKELTMYIMAGKKKLEEVRSGELPALLEKAKSSGLAEDVQAAKDLESKCLRFEKKLHDLELTRTISIQTAPQIRMVQGNDTMMAEKIQSTLVNTVPLWKSQMVIALGVVHSGEAVKAQREVTDMTNELLRKNADMLKTATVETAKETERGIVDMETLQHTNDTLISTLDEVMSIQQEGRQKRAEAETELRRMENELKSKMLEVVNK